MIPVTPAQATEHLAAYDKVLKADIYAAVAIERRLDVFGYHPVDIRAALVAASIGMDPDVAMRESRKTRPACDLAWTDQPTEEEPMKTIITLEVTHATPLRADAAQHAAQRLYTLLDGVCPVDVLSQSPQPLIGIDLATQPDLTIYHAPELAGVHS